MRLDRYSFHQIWFFL